jgi:hypothetical protein
VTAFLDFIPFIGNATGCAFGLISLGIALVLTSITVVIAVIAHNVLLLALVALLIVAGLYVWRQTARKPALAT